MVDYKVGDWLIDKRTNELVEITNDLNTWGIFRIIDVKSLALKGLVHVSDLSTNFTKIDKNCPVARLLYSNNVNKVVTNETDAK